MTNYTEQAGHDVFSSSVAEATRTHNAEMNLAWQFIASTDRSVFLTGKAGTGKTTFLHKLKELTPKRMVVLAPTGVAAINAGGQTIHSFFQLPLGPNIPGAPLREGSNHYRMSQQKKDLMQTLDLLVIDEISMVRCDLLDAVDQCLRKYRDRYKPFGGVQLLLIGDLQQLAPVAREDEWPLLQPYYDTPYFYDSHALRQIDYVTIELQHIYRQQDTTFINLLAQIRSGHPDHTAISLLSERYIPNFTPPQDEDWIRLTTHNNRAAAYNQHMLQSLHTAPPMHFQAQVKGNFPETIYPADFDLTLRIGAQVMFIKNDPSGHGAYYNGKIGTVVDTEYDDQTQTTLITVYCKEDQTTIMLPPVVWENIKYTINPETKQIDEQVDGTFRQYPLRLAWAITIHKSQGLTFDHAVLDINASFSHGQVYVALSRCRTLQGLVLTQPLNPQSIMTDTAVAQYMAHQISDGHTKATQIEQMKHDYYFTLLDQLTDFNPIIHAFAYLTRVVDEHLSRSHPDLLAQLKAIQPRLQADCADVSTRFARQYHALDNPAISPTANHQLQGRLEAAFRYFYDTLLNITTPLLPQLKIEIGNKRISQQYTGAVGTFTTALRLKLHILATLNNPDNRPFTVRQYLDAKARAQLSDTDSTPAQHTKTKKNKPATTRRKRK